MGPKFTTAMFPTEYIIAESKVSETKKDEVRRKVAHHLHCIKSFSRKHSESNWKMYGLAKDVVKVKKIINRPSCIPFRSMKHFVFFVQVYTCICDYKEWLRR